MDGETLRPHLSRVPRDMETRNVSPLAISFNNRLGALSEGRFDGSRFRREYLSDDTRAGLSLGLEGILLNWALGETSYRWVPGDGRKEVEIHVSDCSDEESRGILFSVHSVDSAKLQQKFRVSITECACIEEARMPDLRLFEPFRAPRDLLSVDELVNFIRQQPPARKL